MVDCQPSGSAFDVPLDLNFLVEEGQDEESDDSEDTSPDEAFIQYKEIIQNTYKVRCLAKKMGLPPLVVMRPNQHAGEMEHSSCAKDDTKRTKLLLP